MGSDSPMRFSALIETSERRKHIQSVYDDLGMNRVATVHKSVNKLYSNVQSKVNKKILFVFGILFLLTFISSYWLKPNFLLKSNKIDPKLSKNKDKNVNTTKLEVQPKRINLIKLCLLSCIVASIFTTLLYFLRNRISFVGAMMIEDPLPYL
jgi:flagellar biosynthesis protein FlhB